MNKTTKAFLATVYIFLFANGVAAMTNYELKSPNGKIQVVLRTDSRIEYDVLLNDKPIVKGARLSMDIDHKVIGLNTKIKSEKRDKVDRELVVPVPQKFAKLRENYNELRLEMVDGYVVVFRAYND